MFFDRSSALKHIFPEYTLCALLNNEIFLVYNVAFKIVSTIININCEVNSHLIRKKYYLEVKTNIV